MVQIEPSVFVTSWSIFSGHCWLSMQNLFAAFRAIFRVYHALIEKIPWSPTRQVFTDIKRGCAGHTAGVMHILAYKTTF